MIRTSSLGRGVALVAAAAIALAACTGGATTAPTTAPASDGATAAPTPVPSLDHGFKNGDVLTLITGTNPGGGFDFNLRTIQPFFQDALQELTGTDIRVVVENLPGGGQRVGYEAVARATPDGLTLGLVSHPIMVGHQILSGASYDSTQLTHLAQSEVSNKGFLVPKALALPSRDLAGLIERSQSQPLLWGVAGARTDLVVMTALLKENGVNLNIDQANFDSTSDMVASMLRGELEVIWTTLSSIVLDAQNNPELEVIGTTACERQASAPDLPTIVDEGIAGAAAVCSMADSSARVYIGPVGIPADTAAVLEEALRIALENPEHVALAAERGVLIEYQPGSVPLANVQNLIDVYTKYKDQIAP